MIGETIAYPVFLLSCDVLCCIVIPLICVFSLCDVIVPRENNKNVN